MARDVVEVVARFGDTLLDVAYLRPGEPYRIGTATLRGDTQLGHVSVAFTRTTFARARVARPRPGWRTPVFVVASLFVHVAVVVLAWTLEPLELLAIRPLPRLRHAHVATLAVAANRVDHVEPHIEPVRQVAHHRGHPVSAKVVAAIRDVARSSRLAGVGTSEAYDRIAAEDRELGGSARFDPDAREGFATIPTGGFTTRSFDVTMCPDESCRFDGPYAARAVRRYVQTVMPAIYDCYVQHATGPGTIVLEFTITRRSDGGGAVRDATGSGLGETGDCAAAVIATLELKALAADTHVRYPIRFD